MYKNVEDRLRNDDEKEHNRRYIIAIVPIYHYIMCQFKQ